MRILTIFILACLVAQCDAEDADEQREKGIAALKESQRNPEKIVAAARGFAKAAALYTEKGDEEKAVEANSYLYWCKKKMSMRDIEEFIKTEGPERAKQLEKTTSLAPPVDQAAQWLRRADTFATSNPNEHLLVAIRYFEIADRFKGSPEGLGALDRSLKEMQLSGTTGGGIPPVRIPVAVPAPEGKVPQPDVAKAQQATTGIREMLKDFYVGKKPEEKQTLVEKLVSASADTPQATVEKYAILTELREVAMVNGSTTAALKAHDELNTLFVMDDAQTVAAIQRAGTLGKTDESALFAVCTVALHIADLWVEQRQFDNLNALLAAAQTVEAKLPGRKYAQAFNARIVQYSTIQKEWGTAKTALEKITANPDDAAANLKVGRFYSYILGDWGSGLSALARSSDKLASIAAEKELAKPSAVVDQIALADAWWEISKRSAAPEKRTVEMHAVSIYENALPGASGIEKLRIEKRITDSYSGSAVEIIPPILFLDVRFGIEDKSIDVTSFFQKEVETNPFFAIYGVAPGLKSAIVKTPHLTGQLKCNGRVEKFDLGETDIFLPSYWSQGVPVSGKQFKILNVRVSAARNWLDKTDALRQLVKDANTSVHISDLWDKPVRVDPWPFVGKKVAVWFEFNGKHYGRILGEGFEGQIRP